MRRLPKIIATDLDGTVVRHDLTVAPCTTKVLGALARRGVTIVGVTGRGPRLRDLTMADLPAARFLVMGGGCFVFESIEGADLVSHQATLMPGGNAAEAIRLVEAETGPVRVVVEKHAEVSAPLLGDVITDWPFPVPIVPTAREEALHSEIVKSFILSDNIAAPRLLTMAREVVPTELAAVTHAGVGNVEICPPGIHKNTGLARVAARLGVAASEVLAFGDATNDLPMFAWAGHSVAVANASPEVRAAADEVIPGVSEDGVPRYLEKLFGL